MRRAARTADRPWLRQSLSQLARSGSVGERAASYLAVLALVALDAVFPVAPSETVLVTGGILIERGDLIAPLTARTSPTSRR